MDPLSVQGVYYYQVIGTCANGSVVVVSQIVLCDYTVSQSLSNIFTPGVIGGIIAGVGILAVVGIAYRVHNKRMYGL